MSTTSVAPADRDRNFELDHREALEHLHALTNYEVIPRAGRIDGLSLSPMRAVMASLADPQESYPVIHVTGTNGKGSTSSMIEALLTAMGLRVGTYTSPHLESINERIRVGGESIDDLDLASAITSVAAASESLDAPGLTWFETMTAAAFLHFANEAVDAVVLEVGMLGRFDATNVAHAQIAVVTNVGLDHTDGSGDWRMDIAREKAGIIEPTSILVSGETDPEVVSLFHRERPASILERGIDFSVVDDTLAVGGRLIDVRTQRGRYDELFLNLHGHHQADNASVAIVAVEEFFDSELPADAVGDALGSVAAPGRMEIVGRNPLVMLDVAHNPPGAEVLAAALDNTFEEARMVMVLGMLDGRDPRAVCEALGVADAGIVVACTAPSRRGMPAAAVARAVQECGGVAEIVEDVNDAVDRALSMAGPEDMVLIVGSHTVVGEARGHLIPK